MFFNIKYIYIYINHIIFYLNQYEKQKNIEFNYILLILLK